MDSIMKCQRRYAARKAILAGVWASCFCMSVVAAEIPWPQKSRFQYLAQKKDLRELLREFSISQGLTISIADGVDGNVSGRFDLKPQAMLELLAASHGFLWYYDGSLLHISSSTDVRTEVIQLRFASADQVSTALARLNVLDNRYPLQLDKDGSTILISGPGRYVELVRQIAENIEARHSQNHPAEVRVFPLRFAWAADHEFSSGGQTVVVPGVASMLNALYKPAPVMAAVRQSQNAGTVKKSSPLKSLSAENAPNSQASKALVKADNAKQNAVQDTQENFPVIQASAQINAVVIRDSANRMAQYEGLIEKLDIRPAMIEIEARVIEVRSDEAEKLGVDWRIGGNPTPGVDNSVGRLEAVRNFTNGGGVMKSILANAGLNLLERVSILEAQGKASVSASPTVLTLNNLEARMDNQETFYVRVAGYQSSELFNITAGVTLRVTPMIVDGNTRQRIKLDVRIEDGRVDSTQTVDQIPTVNRSEITTQGFVNNGESLLIAGYSVEQDTNQTANVPGLSKVPLLGGLFRNKAMAKLKTQRLFLLTPRIVEEQEESPVAKHSLNRELGIDGITLKPDMALIFRDQLKYERNPDLAGAQPPAAANEIRAPQTAAAENKPEKITANWEIAAGDNTLKSALSRWSADAGWQLSWELPVDYPIQARTTITASFEDAVETVATSMKDVQFPIKVIFYKANKVLRVIAKGEE